MKIPTICFTGLLLILTVSLSAQTVDTTKFKPSYFEVNDFVKDNERCLRCHAEEKYTIENEDRVTTEPMCPERIHDRDAFYSGVHKSFACNDCHSYGYEEFPHSLETRMEETLMCMDCHGYDESFAQYHFEEIEIEFGESAHNMKDFTCWSCHDPHSYKAFMRNADDLAEAIVYDNNMCLRCHSDFSRFMLLSDREEINVVASHEWLPNQISHFKHVRCIECHTEINDTILIAHKILPKTAAVKNCEECHSKDSRLMHTLYKFQGQDNEKGGFANAVMINESFVIGANQNVFLNKLSFILLGLMMVVIVFHIYLRIRKQKTSKHGNS